jgi:amino acid adenylation domain-containing protein/non-ribosomal peptide synthase protein (TIGR01720 family)
MANFSFDVFSGDLVRSLLSGAKLVICPREWLLEPQLLYDLMVKEHIQCAEFVPAVFRQLIDSLDKNELDLHFVQVRLCGSDVWYVGEYQRFLSFCGSGTRLINSYGLTEATIDSSFFEATSMKLSSNQVVPIGRPYSNMRLYILDSHLNPVPPGVYGELAVGGLGVSEGYHNRPELTGEKFIPDPFSDQLNALMYRTGDFARFQKDGNIEFTGRADNQVKIRGFRIETGEIEAVLNQHPSVRQAIVNAVSPVREEAGAGEAVKRLVAYLVADIQIERVPLVTTCEILQEPQPRNRSEPGIKVQTVDISTKGVCLADLPGDWVSGDVINMRLDLPGVKEDAVVSGVVAWRKGERTGVAFDVNVNFQAQYHRSIKHIIDTEGLLLTENLYDTRTSIHTPVKVNFTDGTSKELVVENLSGKGARIITDNGYFKKSPKVNLLFELPGEHKPFMLDAEVNWEEGNRVFVNFEATSPQQAMIGSSLEAIIYDSGTTLTQLKAYLKEKLPEYMVPSMFVMLSAFPLTPNGKIDRKAFPVPEWTDRDLEIEFVPLNTATQQTLGGIWSKVLGVEKIGALDNFFDLGGHSLLATQVISRIREIFEVDLPLRVLFEYPILIDLATQIEAAQQTGVKLEEVIIESVSRTEKLPLSFAEQRLWFLDQLNPDNPFYNIPEFIRIRGRLNLETIKKCLENIMSRHEILRTTFQTVDGEPFRVIHESLPLKLDITDLTSLEKSAQEQAVVQIGEKEARTIFKLDKGPLLKLHVAKISQDEHVFFLTMHHIISDDWSSGLFIYELGQLYEAFARKQPSPLPPLTIQYADYAYWQRNWLKGDVLEEQLNYWKNKLKDTASLLNLPTDYPRPAVMSFEGATSMFKLSRRLTRAVQELCQSEGVTLFMVLMAAFQALLYRYTWQDDICVGTPIANRNRRDIEKMIGFFVNTLVMRGDLSGDPTFRTLLKRVKKTALEAYGHQDLPFEMIVDALNLDRDISHTPLFQVMFVLQNESKPGGASSALEIIPLDTHSGTAKFDLTLFMMESENGLEGAFEYSTELFTAATIERMTAHFETILSGLVLDLDTRVSLLPILSDSETDEQVETWNDTDFDYPRDSCAHELFEEMAIKYPSEIALRYKNTKYTYRQLDTESNQIAHYLIKHGVKLEQLVGLFIPRTPELMSSMLGILKAGAAYVPLDPALPAERVRLIIEDAEMLVLLTHSSLLDQLIKQGVDLEGVKVICLDFDMPRIRQQSEETPHVEVTSQNLAYVIYTSGSTGKPKGAMIEHQGFVNYLTWCKQVYPLDIGQGSPVHSSISFDLTITSLYTPLISGKTVVLLSEEKGVQALGDDLKVEDDYSLIKITPAHLQMLGQDTLPLNAARKTHAFIIGGENLLVDHIDFWQRNAPNIALVNEYGPTETVVGCCVYWASPGEYRTGVIPIGRPIINTQLYVLDRNQQLLPPGVPGELYIGGDGVCRGYWKRPELTAERFIPDPFRDEPGARLYRTGDLVRLFPDGNMICLGRIDFQVKIRGYRVELGEIETILSQHPAVDESVVWVHEKDGIKRLVGYVVLTDIDSPIEEGELIAFLKEKLPDYMVPIRVIFLDEMPMASSGKLDRKALPVPEEIEQVELVGYAAPQMGKEKKLAAIWEKVLGYRPIGRHDNFFELGGDSIMVIQVISRSNQAGFELTPRDLFNYPTIAELAELTKTHRQIIAEQGQVLGEVELTPVQHWFFDLGLEKPNHWNQSVFLKLEKPLDKSILDKTLKRLVEHHDMLRASAMQQDERWGLWIKDMSKVEPLMWVDLKTLSEKEQLETLDQMTANHQASLSLFNGCLMRAAYFDLGGRQPDHLLISIHHLAVDGVSWRILLEDFLTVYQQIENQVPVSLPNKTTSFKEWSNYLIQFAHSEHIQAQLAYWKAVKGQRKLVIPVDRDAENNFEKDSAVVSKWLDEEETERLLRDVIKINQTDINTILLSSVAQVFAEWMDVKEVVIDMEGHGREEISEQLDVSRTIGWFTAIYPLVLPVAKETVQATLNLVDQTLSQVPDNGIGYGLLRYLTENGKKALSGQAEVPISFNYLGQMSVSEQTLPFKMAQRDAGQDRSPDNHRPHLLDVTFVISGGRLQMEIAFNEKIHLAETADHLCKAVMDQLRILIRASQEHGIDDVSEDRYEAFGWDAGDIEDILGELDEMDGETSKS